MIYALGPPGHGEVWLIRAFTAEDAAEMARVAWPMRLADKPLDVFELEGGERKVHTSEAPSRERPLMGRGHA